MDKRVTIHQKLLDAMHNAYLKAAEDYPGLADFSKNVYFQAPQHIDYPAIVYERSSGNDLYADGNPYRFEYTYTITIIDTDPDSYILDQVAMLPKSRYIRHYVADNLHHDVFEIFY